MRPEEKIHFALCQYLDAQYPNVIFLSESSGLRVSRGMAIKLKKTRSHHTHLDLYILEPRGKFHGLILELKANSIYKKDGKTLLSNPHHEDQAKTIELLKKKGYQASFACSLQEGIKLINQYLNG